jgi:hypothetical protein
MSLSLGLDINEWCGKDVTKVERRNKFSNYLEQSNVNPNAELFRLTH